MALAEAARFDSLPEAEVASSALRACGIEAEVMDRDPAQSGWREPYGEGGVRLGVPEADVDAARALLAQMRRPAAGDPPWSRARPSLAERLTPWRLAVVAVIFLAILAFALWGRL